MKIYIRLFFLLVFTGRLAFAQFNPAVNFINPQLQISGYSYSPSTGPIFSLSASAGLQFLGISPNTILTLSHEYNFGITHHQYLLIQSDTLIEFNDFFDLEITPATPQSLFFNLRVSLNGVLLNQSLSSPSLALPTLVEVEVKMFNDQNQDNFFQMGEPIITHPFEPYVYANYPDSNSISFVSGSASDTSGNSAMLVPIGFGGLLLPDFEMNLFDSLTYFEHLFDGINDSLVVSGSADTLFYFPATLLSLTPDSVIILNIQAPASLTPLQNFVISSDAYVVNYQAGDTVQYEFIWDDGSSSIFTTDQPVQTFPARAKFSGTFNHAYSQSGLYRPSVVVSINGHYDTTYQTTSVRVLDGGYHVLAKTYLDLNQNCVKDSNEFYTNIGGVLLVDYSDYQGTWEQNSTLGLPFPPFNGMSNSYISRSITGLIKLYLDTINLQRKSGAWLSPCQPSIVSLNTQPGDTVYYEFALGGFNPAIESKFLSYSGITNQNCDSVRIQFSFQYESPDEMEDSLKVKIYFGDGAIATFNYTNSQGNVNPMDGSVIESNKYFYHTYPGSGQYICQAIVYAGSVVDSSVLGLVNVPPCGQLVVNTIIDFNEDCLTDFSDLPLQGLPLSMNLPSFQFNSITDVFGQAFFGNYADSLPYTLTAGSNLQNGFTFNCPANGSFSDTTGYNPETKNIYVKVNPGIDLFVKSSPAFLRPGFDFLPEVSAGNYHYAPCSGAIMKVLPGPGITFLSSNPAPQSTSGDTLFYSINQQLTCGNFAMVNQGQLFSVHFNFEPDTNLAAGDSVALEAWILSDSLDVDLQSNYSLRKYPVVNSFDPNMLVVSPQGLGPQGYIPNSTTLFYTLHFQNVGNAPSFRVRIIDTLDANVLNLNTLTIVESSHPMTYYLANNSLLKFDFNGIYLPDSASNFAESSGYVVYSVELQSNLPDNTEIRNRAGIYFDFNEAVVTNQTLNTVSNLITPVIFSQQPSREILVYPVPASEELFITFPDGFLPALTEVYDITGALVLRSKSYQKSISLQSLSKGWYWIRCTDRSGKFRQSNFMKG